MVDLNKRALLGAPILASLALPSVSRPQTVQPVCPGPTDTAPNYDLPIHNGPFKPNPESLKTYQTPDWFRDAKFGIWAHWGPQAVPRRGDWYARFMYCPGHPDYDHHLQTYGHPSQFGYKDIIPLWKAEKFDPEVLMDKYVAAGAKYFVAMGCHHDNFDLWDSRHHRWNAAQMGPKRDIVGSWKKAATNRGIRFGVSEHMGASYAWFTPSHGYDLFWPHLGVDYDGADPKNQDLYHPRHDEPFKGNDDTWYAKNPAWHQAWFNRVTDLLDQHQPDLLYTDGWLPFGVVGQSMLASFFNANQAAHGGKLEAVYNCKLQAGKGPFAEAGVQDVERGVLNGINPLPWQTDTSNGDWFYKDGSPYKSTGEVVRMLADIVSKNGNLLLNIVLYPDGSLPVESQTLLDEMTVWMKFNAEAIHGTRPWKVYGEGPTKTVEGRFNERDNFTADDIRFTTKRDLLFAITLGEPKKPVVIQSLGLANEHGRDRVKSVHILGGGKVEFTQTEQALIITPPAILPTAHASVFQVTFWRT